MNAKYIIKKNYLVFPKFHRKRFFIFFIFSVIAYIPFALLFNGYIPFRRPCNGKRCRTPPSYPPPLTVLPHREGWQFNSAPKFCQKIISKPLRYNGCVRNEKTQECSDGSVRMMSQFMQDYYLYTKHFSRLRRRGIYLDVAANHPSYISNTYFMDACLGWDGVCVEANPMYHELLRTERTCHIISTCVSNKEGQNVTFLNADGLGGIVKTNKNMVKPSIEFSHFIKRDDKINLTCTMLSSVLKKKEVIKVDFLSLDVEGHELEVLEGINWNSVIINVISVEVTAKTLTQIEDLVVSKGYKRHFPAPGNTSTIVSSHDAIFLHKSVKFGHPR